MYPKNLWLALSLSLTAVITQAAADYASGEIRTKKILFHKETGIPANKANLRFAEAENIAKDLNTPAILETFSCQTKVGKALLESMINNPLSPDDKNVLLERQRIIKALVENPEFRDQVGRSLTMAKHHEVEVNKLLSEQFIRQICREIADLELAQRGGTWTPYSIKKFMTFNAAGWGLSSTLKTAVVGSFGYLAKLRLQELYKNRDAIRQGLSRESFSKMLENFNQYPPEMRTGMLIGLAVGTGIEYLIWSKVANTASELRTDYLDAREKRLKIHSLNALIELAEQFEIDCEAHSVQNQFKLSDIDDAKAVEILNGLKHSRYEDENSYLFMPPVVHTFIHTLYENDKHLAPIFASIAEMDVYYAIAMKIIETQNQPNKLCFVTYADGKQPAIKTTQFWNMLVENPVLNDISESNKIILTGPNAGGKTTAIRALLQNIVLGQTFGIAAADEFVFTPFDIIHSYLNVSDDLLNGNSLFVSEVKRANDILQKAKSLQASNKNYFFALDELFTGTVAQDGEKCAYQFISNMASFTQAQFIYATHFAKLKDLGYDVASGCVNYQVDAPTKNDAGKLVYPFTISHGASTVDVGLDIAQEAGLFQTV